MSQEQKQDPAARLAALESVCERLWPAVRFFGISGAAPQYVEAMHELGVLLGKIESAPAPVDTTALTARVRSQTLAEAVAILRESEEVRGAVGRRMQAEVAQAAERAFADAIASPAGSAKR